MSEFTQNEETEIVKSARCKCQYKNVAFLSYKNVGKPTRLYDIFI